MKTIPQISKFMTVHPHTIGVEQTLSKAHTMMREFKIRHLPVLDAGKLVGILSDRDIKSVMTFKDVNPDVIKVSEALTEAPFTVKPTSQLDDVCAEMGAHKYGSALVVDNGKLVGIFTWVDGLNALTELLGTRLKK
jgi:acetoin utilization protein AcuB